MPEDADPPLLFVHGYMDATTPPFSGDTFSARWQALSDHIADRGYSGPITSVDFGMVGTTVGSPRRYADTVTAETERLSKEYGEPVNVIGHSMGGLSTRWAVEQEDADQYVGTVVTLGTPHQGTPSALLGILTPGGRDMVPGSRFLTTLNADGPAPNVDYITVYSTADATFPCSATCRAAYPDAGVYDNVEAIRVEGYSHLDLVRDDAVLDTYYEQLVEE